MCPCIHRVIRNWWPTRCNFLLYLFVPSQLCMFREMFSPSSGAFDCIYSFCYSPPMLLPAGVMDEVERRFHLVHDTGQQQHRWTISEAVNTLKYSWWWEKTSPETCRADCVQINKPKICIFLPSITNYMYLFRDTKRTWCHLCLNDEVSGKAHLDYVLAQHCANE